MLDYHCQLWEYYGVTGSIQKHTVVGVSASFNLFPSYTNLSIPACSCWHTHSSHKHSHIWIFSKPFLLPQVNTGSQKSIDDTHLGSLEYFFEWHGGFNLDCYFCMIIQTSPGLTSACCVMTRDHWVLTGSFMVKNQGQFWLDIIIISHFWRKGAFRQWTKYSRTWQVPLWYMYWYCWLKHVDVLQVAGYISHKNKIMWPWRNVQLMYSGPMGLLGIVPPCTS